MTGGVGAALDQAVQVAEDLPDREAFVQAALFDDLEPQHTGALDAPSPLSRLFEPKKRGGPGRPRGSKNRRTEEVAAWLLSQHRHPVLVMMEGYSCSPAELAEKIGLKPGYWRQDYDGEGKASWAWVADAYGNDLLLELFKLQQTFAERAAPYVASKMPLAVSLDAKASLSLTLAGVNLPARGGVAGGSEPEAIEGMAVRLPFKSDGPSRTDSQDTD